MEMKTIRVVEDHFLTLVGETGKSAARSAQLYVQIKGRTVALRRGGPTYHYVFDSPQPNKGNDDA
jgi:hypothetical protein